MISLFAAISWSTLVVIVHLAAGVFFWIRRRDIPAMLGAMLGMTSGMLAGLLVGCLLGAATDMFTSNLVGMAVGIALGVGFGAFGGLMGALDGGMGGLMGGMMGAMLGVMVGPPASVWITSGVLGGLNLLGLAVLVHLVRQQQIGPTAVDPVCEMEVEIEHARWASRVGDETLYFCAAICKREFDANPEPYMTRLRRAEMQRGM